MPDHPGKFISSTADENGIVITNSVIPGTYRIYVSTEYFGLYEFFEPDWLKAHENDFAPLQVVAGTSPSIALALKR